ncbi:netrin receptor DCC isoform X2 [Nematostella vectensis]|uniref:netrin receptor DCC isoform X2 n=1 Tax=Nematostella vectensis TaxID=45351 RepID=UPI0020773D22|nr:netrin receptor DCC isoform X2 [Nematostella vectensis]
MIHRNSKSGFVFQLLVIWASHGLAHGVFILRFVKSPPRVTQVPERSVAILPCAAESILQPLTYKWLLNGQLLSIRSNGNYTWQGYQGNLLIPSLRQNSLNDGGLFQCTASNSLGSILGPISVLRVAYLEPYEGQAILKGYSKYTFESFCLDPPLVTSVPMATVTWSRVTGSVIHDGDKLGRVLIASGGHLCVLAADNTDIDMYTCTLNNPVTQQSFSIKHSVALVGMSTSQKLSFLKRPRDAQVVEGRDQFVVFECIMSWEVEYLGNYTYNGYYFPVKPKISWYKGNNVLSPSSKYGFVHNTTSTKIAIYRPTKADEGTYRCVAIDTSNVVFVAQAQLTVKTEIEESSPKFDGTLPPSMVAFLGKSAKITCPRARGALTYTWYHNAVPVSPDHRVSVTSNGSLLIKDVMRPDNGIYQVFAENSFGKSSAEPVYLLVSELNVISTTSTSPSPLPSPSPTSITPPASVTLPNSTNSIQPTTVAKEQPSSREPFTEPNTRLPSSKKVEPWKNIPGSKYFPGRDGSTESAGLGAKMEQSRTERWRTIALVCLVTIGLVVLGLIVLFTYYKRKNLLKLPSVSFSKNTRRLSHSERFESNVYVSIHDDSNPLYSGFCPNRQEPNSSKNPMYSGTHHDRQDPDSGKNHLYSGIHHNRQEPNSSKNPLYSGTHHDREDPDSCKNHLYSGIHPDRQYHDVDKTHLYSSIYLDSQDPHKDKNHPYSGIHPDGSGAFPSRTSTRETSTTSNIYEPVASLEILEASNGIQGTSCDLQGASHDNTAMECDKETE